MPNTNLTAADIQGLRTAAASAGDHLQVLICEMALNGGEVDSDALSMVPLREHHRIPAGEAEAIEACREAIEVGRAQDDSQASDPLHGYSPDEIVVGQGGQTLAEAALTEAGLRGVERDPNTTGGTRDGANVLR